MASDSGTRGKPRGRRAAARRPGNGGTGLSDAGEVVNCLRRMFRAIQEYSKAIQRQVGLSAPQVWALTILAAEPGLSLGDLADRMFAHPSTVSGVVDRLVERKAVTRAVDPEDRRGVRLTLTPLGKKVLASSPPPVQVSLSRALESLPPERLRDLRASLEHVVGLTEAGKVEAGFFDIIN